MRQGKWDDAAVAFEECCAQPGARPAALHNLAYALERLGQYDEAQSRARRGDPARRREGRRASRRRSASSRCAPATSPPPTPRWRVARPLFGTRPPTAAWFHYAALAAALLGDLDRALAILTEGVGLHPHAAPLHNNLAAVHERRGYHPEALARRRARGAGGRRAAAAAQEPRRLPLPRRRATTRRSSAYQRAIKLNPTLGDDVYLKLGNIRFKRQERDEAVRCWEQALELDPDNAIVRTNLDAVRQVL